MPHKQRIVDAELKNGNKLKGIATLNYRPSNPEFIR